MKIDHVMIRKAMLKRMTKLGLVMMLFPTAILFFYLVMGLQALDGTHLRQWMDSYYLSLWIGSTLFVLGE